MAPDSEAGFTLTELVVGLVVSSLLVVGLVELTRRYGQTTNDVRLTVADARASRAIDGLLTMLERADPETIIVTSQRIAAKIGSAEVSAQLQSGRDGSILEWRSPSLQRSLALPAGARFEQRSGGLIVLLSPDSSAPIAIATLRRELPFDCQFDTVTLECRQ